MFKSCPSFIFIKSIRAEQKEESKRTLCVEVGEAKNSRPPNQKSNVQGENGMLFTETRKVSITTLASGSIFIIHIFSFSSFCSAAHSFHSFHFPSSFYFRGGKCRLPDRWKWHPKRRWDWGEKKRCGVVWQAKANNMVQLRATFVLRKDLSVHKSWDWKRNEQCGFSTSTHFEIHNFSKAIRCQITELKIHWEKRIIRFEQNTVHEQTAKEYELYRLGLRVYPMWWEVVAWWPTPCNVLRIIYIAGLYTGWKIYHLSESGLSGWLAEWPIRPKTSSIRVIGSFPRGYIQFMYENPLRGLCFQLGFME